MSEHPGQYWCMQMACRLQIALRSHQHASAGNKSSASAFLQDLAKLSPIPDYKILQDAYTHVPKNGNAIWRSQGVIKVRATHPLRQSRDSDHQKVLSYYQPHTPRELMVPLSSV